MANFPGGVLIPDLQSEFANYELASFGAPNANGEGLAFIFRVPSAGTLEKIAYYPDLIVGSGTLRVSIQGVTSSGLPNGTVAVYRESSMPSAGWQETGILSDNGTDGGNKLAMTAGQLLALCFEYTAFTSGSFAVYAMATWGNIGFPYCVTNLTGSWGKAGSSHFVPNFALKYDSGAYEIPRWCTAMSATTANETVLTTVSSPDEAGVSIVPPWDCVTDGAYVHMRPETSCRVSLYNSAGTRLASNTWSTGLSYAALPPGGGGYYYWFSWDEVELTSGNEYVIAVAPTAAGNVTVYDIPFNSAAILAASQGGTTGVRATRSGGSGTFTNGTTRKGSMALHLSGIL